MRTRQPLLTLFAVLSFVTAGALAQETERAVEKQSRRALQSRGIGLGGGPFHKRADLPGGSVVEIVKGGSVERSQAHGR